MFVKLQTSLAGPNGSHPFGAVVEMEDAEAARYCEANLAVEATEADIAAHEARVAADLANAPSAPSSDNNADGTGDTSTTVDFSKMTKAQIAAHAAEVHGLELNPAKSTKDELIAAIATHVETKASEQSS